MRASLNITAMHQVFHNISHWMFYSALDLGTLRYPLSSSRNEYVGNRWI